MNFLRMNKVWAPEAWEDYVYWQSQDKRTLKRVNKLIKDIERNGPGIGIGKPEKLKGELEGLWSRRIDEKNRLVYRIHKNNLEIVSCRTHYGDKRSVSPCNNDGCHGSSFQV